MAGLLVQYLRETNGKMFQYGECDCAQWVAQYIKQVCGVDPGTERTAEYYDDITCAMLLARTGGLLRLVETQFAAYPEYIIECDHVNCGYEVPIVGVVNYMDTQFVAIRTRGGWAMKKRGVGYHVVSASSGKLCVLKSWRLTCPQL